jgi:undecaprenyl-diphosphatase
MYTFDHDLFLLLNFDGGKVMDFIMETISGTLMWLPLYFFIIAFVWYKLGWQRALGFIVCLVLAIGFSDIICGIFKHTGPLKNLWASFPARPRPMCTAELEGLFHTPCAIPHRVEYGTVSAHAATTVALAWFSALAIRRNWYNWVISVSVIAICYSRIYLAKHFPVDLLLGAVVGTICGVLIFFLWKKFDKVLEKVYFCGRK